MSVQRIGVAKVDEMLFSGRLKAVALQVSAEASRVFLRLMFLFLAFTCSMDDHAKRMETKLGRR